jgi:hypothetical protein
MIESIAAIAVPALIAACFVWLMRREDTALRRRAQRVRQLELEGLGELRGRDAYSEEAGTSAGSILDPDGSVADIETVLRNELAQAREHTRVKAARRPRTRSLRGWKGAECLG